MAEAESARERNVPTAATIRCSSARFRVARRGEMAPLFGSNSILGSVSHWRVQQVLPSHRAPFFVTCRSWQFRRKGVLHDRYCQEPSPCVLKQTYPPICAKRRGIGPVSALLSSETTYGGPSLGMWDIGVLYTWVPIISARSTAHSGFPPCNAVALARKVFGGQWMLAGA